MRSILSVLGLVLLCTACEKPADGRLGVTGEALDAPAFVQPAGTVAVGFSVDDRLNRVYGEGDLKWKGGFILDPATRILTRDDGWSGGVDLEGFPTLHDDGPWTTGGHEPVGAQPGDHVWGVTVFVAPPVAGEDAFQYGLIDALYERSYGNGWIWYGPNGTFVVPAGATEPITAEGMRFDKFGKQDLRFVLDTKALSEPGWTWDTWFVGVKSSWWGWAVAGMADLGDGVYAVDLGSLLEFLPHTGFMMQGSSAEFVFMLGDYEYVVWNTDGTNWWPEVQTAGVTVQTRCKNAEAWVPVPIEFADDLNTMITAPSACAP